MDSGYDLHGVNDDAWSGIADVIMLDEANKSINIGWCVAQFRLIATSLFGRSNSVYALTLHIEPDGKFAKRLTIYLYNSCENV